MGTKQFIVPLTGDAAACGCCDGDIVVPCCGVSIADTLYALVEDGGGCACASGELELVWGPSEFVFGVERWGGEGTFGCGTMRLELYCDEEEGWKLAHEVDCGGGSDFVEGNLVNSVSCSPLQLIWNKVTTGGDLNCCPLGAGYKVTITE